MEFFVDSCLSKFRKREDGSATIESVLWLPVFIAFLVLVADASFMFFGQNQAYRIIQDANRSLSVGRLRTEEEVVDRIEAQLANLAPNAIVSAAIDSGTITSVATIPASDLTATRFFTAFIDLDLTVGARHYVEYRAMNIQSFRQIGRFGSREDGAMTIFGIYIFLSMAILSAIAVDVANLMAARNQLQVAADTAGHAALYYRDISHRDPNSAQDSKAKAIEMAGFGMPSQNYGAVIGMEDIVFGTWDHELQAFHADDSSRDAVMVKTSRMSSKSNSVASLLFKFVGIDDWDIVTPAVFATYRPMCFREGFVADGVVDLQSNNGYSNGFCIHSNDHVEMNSNNTFEGVQWYRCRMKEA